MVKVKLEHKRGRFVLHVGELKLECTIEPRRWRNPLLAVAALVLLPPLFFTRPDVLTLLTTANIYACVAIPVAWQMVGIGRMNFGPQIFIGIGGFTAALLSIHLGLGPLQSLPFVIVMGLLFGLILSPLTIVAKGLYYSIITLVLPLIFMQLTYVYSNIFGGEYGLSGVQKLISLGSMKLNYLVTFYLSLLMMLVFMFIVNAVFKSRIGLFAAAINDDEDVADALGLNVNWWKITCYTITSAMVALAGWFMAYNVGGFSGETYLPLPFMLKILLIVMIGGRGEIYGTLIGAYFVSFLETWLMAAFGSISHVLFPLILVVLLLTLREGLYGLYSKHKYREYYPTVRVRKR